jgi:hypothetical protein
MLRRAMEINFGLVELTYLGNPIRDSGGYKETSVMINLMR